MSIHLTRELFEIKRDEKSGEIKMFIGTKRNNIGFLSVNWHTKKWFRYGPPNSIRIKKLPNGTFTVSFCFGEEEKSSPEKTEQANWFNFLREHKTEEELEKIGYGISEEPLLCSPEQIGIPQNREGYLRTERDTSEQREGINISRIRFR